MLRLTTGRAAVLSLLMGCAPAASVVTPLRGAERAFIRGADISMLPRIEAAGGSFIDNGERGDCIAILANHGCNFIRLRAWHSPPDGYCSTDGTITMARRIRGHGLGFLLDLHYSDTWADPGAQTKPASWRALAFDALRDSVYQYTRGVIDALKRQDLLPDMVQIGNEITCGMLWNDGRLCGPHETPERWRAFATLVAAGISGVRDCLAPGDSVSIMIHIDRGGDNAACTKFFDNLIAHGVGFDLIGLSFYPWWHGTLDALSANLDSLAARYGRGIIVVETAYPWTLGWCDQVHNIVGLPGQLHDGYPATVLGQQDFLDDLIDAIESAPDGRGLGFFYWAPEYISAPSIGSPWENLALFDFSGALLHSIGSFERRPAR